LSNQEKNAVRIECKRHLFLVVSALSHLQLKSEIKTMNEQDILCRRLTYF